jgi:hypothetical protein
VVVAMVVMVVMPVVRAVVSVRIMCHCVVCLPVVRPGEICGQSFSL